MEKKIIIAKKIDKLANILSCEGFSYNYASKLIRNKDVKIDGVRVKENVDVMVGSEISVFYDEQAIAKKFEIVFEDENIYILNKKSGVEVEGELGLEGLLPNSIAVHRLDRNTEGLMVMAKNKTAEQILLKAFKNRSIQKKYIAEVVGATHFKGEVAKAFLLKDKETSFVKIFSNKVKGSEEILTAFTTLKSNPSSSIVECKLITGKTHQIRAHLSYLGHPIIGDGKYGKNEDNRKFKQKWQKLFCFNISFYGLEKPLDYLNNKQFIKYPDWYKN